MSKIEKEINGLILSGDHIKIQEGIKLTRENGCMNCIHLLLEIYKESDAAIQSEITKIVTDAREEKTTDIIMNYFMQINDYDAYADIISACWQNGLNFSQYIPDFLNVMDKGEFQTAIEAFTVIEESLTHCDDSKLKKYRELVAEKALIKGDMKQDLYKELMITIDNFISA